MQITKNGHRLVSGATRPVKIADDGGVMATDDDSSVPVVFPSASSTTTKSSPASFSSAFSTSRAKLSTHQKQQRLLASSVATNKMTSEGSRNLCYCNFEPPLCQLENACIKHDRAACFHAVKQEFDHDLGLPIVQHIYGCAPLEGADASHLTCNSWRFTHSSPRTIACCYEGNFCNHNLSVPEFFQHKKRTNTIHSPNTRHHQTSAGIEAFIFLAFGFLLGLGLLLAIFFLMRHFCERKGKNKKLTGRLHNNSGGLEASDGCCDAILSPSSPYSDLHHPLVEDSGSGSNGLTLNQRTIAMDLQMLEVFARGRYGELRKAIYRGSLVAVKIFYTTEEESWRNEREIYLSQMLNHENILQYVAADITSSVESLTQMMLITDYHPLGSLYDYLRGDFSLQLNEALELAFTTISGLEHLHNAVRGTSGRYKPEIAHRDIKSKNVLVKRRGVCCLADFGLAVRNDLANVNNNNGEDSQNQKQQQHGIVRRVNIQVGTKRYMAPELLSRRLNVENFEEFKWADIYSFSLVLWELLNRVALPQSSQTSNGHRQIDGLSAAEGIRRNHQRLMSQSHSSGIVSGGSDFTTTTTDAAVSTSYPFADSESSPSPISPPILIGSRHQFLFGNLENQKSTIPTGHSGSTTTDSGACSMGREVDSSSSWAEQNNKRVYGQQQQQRGEPGRCQQQQPHKRAHQLPYQCIVETDPTFEQMCEVVCEKKIRPPIDPKWTNEAASPQMRAMCGLMAECWSEQARSRHTALKIKKELRKCLLTAMET